MMGPKTGQGSAVDKLNRCIVLMQLVIDGSGTATFCPSFSSFSYLTRMPRLCRKMVLLLLLMQTLQSDFV